MTKRKRFKHLSVFDRAIIGQKRKEGLSCGEIGKIIGHPKSTVFREVEKRKSKNLGFYRADVAHEKALNKRGKRGARKRLKNETIRSYVKEKLKLGWSPEQIALRLPIDHPEDDTIVSRQSPARLKSINERASGVVFLGKMADGTSEESTRVVCERLSAVPSSFRKTLARDRGTENMGYKNIETNLNLSCFFAHSYCSYERGSNENLNGLARRFLPKKTDFAKVSDEQIRRVEYLLNTRPRKRFGGKTPLEVLLEKTGVAFTY